MNNNIEILLIAILSILFIVISIRRFVRNYFDILFDVRFYFIITFLLYVAYPIIYFGIESRQSFYQESFITQKIYSQGVLYILLLMIIFYYPSKGFSFSKADFMPKADSITLRHLYIYFILLSLIFIFVTAVFITNFDILIISSASREIAAEVKAVLNNKYKLTLLIHLQVSIIIYLYFKYRRLFLLAFIAPFLMFDILLYSRDYLFYGFVLLSLILSTRLNQFKIKYILFIFFLYCLLILIEPIRVDGFSAVLNFDGVLRSFEAPPGEFLGTTMAGFAIIENGAKITSVLEFLIYNIALFPLPKSFITPFFSEVIQVGQYVGQVSNLHYSLGGGFMAEYFLLPELFQIIYPFYIALFLSALNFLVRFLSKKLRFVIFGLFLMNLYVTFRMGFISAHLLVFYYFLLFILIILLTRFIYNGFRLHLIYPHPAVPRKWQ